MNVLPVLWKDTEYLSSFCLLAFTNPTSFYLVVDVLGESSFALELVLCSVESWQNGNHQVTPEA